MKLNIAVVCVLLAVACLGPVASGWSIGGKTPVDMKDQGVVKAANFAVAELNKRGTNGAVTLKEVVSAERQVVAGMNYILVLKLTEGSAETLHRTTVYDQFGKLSMTKDEILKGLPVKKYTQSARDALGGAAAAASSASGAANSSPSDPVQTKNEAAARAYMSRLGRGAARLVTRIIAKPSTCDRKAANGDKLAIHYVGTLSSNGKKFDSSYDRDEPFKFTLGQGQVIKGWEQGIPGMCVGEKRRLLIPSALGYGSRGFGTVIPPNSALDFTVQLISIE
jgi:FKBP-type peptidyl-prolyl cis-trans isomerase